MKRKNTKRKLEVLPSQINKTNCLLLQWEKIVDYFHDYDYLQQHISAYVSRVLNVPKMAFDKCCNDKFPAEKKRKKKNISQL